MTSQVVFRLDTKLKEKALKQARQEAVLFSAVLQRFVKRYVKGDYYLDLVPTVFNEKTRRSLAKSLKEIDEGKGLSPTFTNVEDMIEYLHGYSK